MADLGPALIGLAGVAVGGGLGGAVTYQLARRQRDWAREDADLVRTQGREDSRAEWVRAALHDATGEFMGALKGFQHTIGLASHEISSERTPDLSAVMDDYRSMAVATARIVPLLPHHVGDQAMELELGCTLLLGAVRGGQPVGVGTPTEDLWRSFGRKSGLFLSEVRYRLTGEVPPGYEASN